MVSKLYDGSNWKNLNGLKLWDGSAWKNSVRGWMWNGAAWKQWYPEYPINTSAPTVSGSTTQGNTLSTTNGSWNSNLAYNPASYSYQWRRGASDISGATSSTYVTQVSDVGNEISCRVTATNNRGPTSQVSSNSITIVSALPGAPSNLSVTNATPNPGSFTVSSSSTSPTPTITMGGNTNVTSSTGQINWISSSQSSWSSTGTFSGSGSSETSVYKSSLSASTAYTGTVTVTGPGATTATGSWTLPTNVSYYSYSLTPGLSLSSNEGSRTFTISGGSPGGFYQLFVAAWNTNGVASISWTAGSNATSYDIYINGSLWQQSYNGTSVTYNWGTTGNLTVNVRSRNSSGVESTGVTSTVSINQTTTQPQTTGTFAAAKTASANYSLTTSAPPAVAPSTPTNLVNQYSARYDFEGNFIGPTWTGSWTASSGTATITYYWTLTQSATNGGSTTATASGSTTGTSFVQDMSSANGLWARFTVYAQNSAGTSGTATSSWA